MNTTKKEILSLGFSCQSRFSINRCIANPTTYPFDWLIITKQFLLNALLHDGANLWTALDQPDMHQMPVEKTQGIAGDGVYYWHDFPRDGEVLLSANWRDNIKKVKRKYRHLWKKFSIALRNPHIEKNLLIANTQHNLEQFAQSPEEFDIKFGIDEKFIKSLVAGLLQFNAVHFKVIVLARDIGAVSVLDDLVDIQFAGVLSLPTNDLIATSLSLCHSGPQLDAICLNQITGKYNNGAEIIRHAGKLVCIVYNSQGLPWAEVRPFPGGYIFAFHSLVDGVFTAIYEHGQIVFSNNSR